MLTWLRSLPQRDLRANIALVAQIGGTIALTAIVVWIIWIFWRGEWPNGTELARIDKIGLIGVLVTVIMGINQIGLGLAINRRSVRGSAFGASFEASGGEDETPTTEKIAAAAAGAAAGATTAAVNAASSKEELPKP